MARAAFVALLTTLVLAAPAAAQGPVPTPTPTPPAPTPTPTPTPAAGTLTIKVTAPYHDRKRRVALRGDHVRVDGVLAPGAQAQKVVVRALRKGKRIGTKVAHTHADGTFAVSLRLRRPGSIVVDAVHAASPQVAAARARRVRVTVARPSAGFGAKGVVVRLLQAGLDRLRYRVDRTGVFDAATGRAVMAYRKVTRRPRNEFADAGVVRNVLRGRGAYHVRHPRAGHHVEADLARQIIALVDGSRLIRVYPTSSGKPSTPTVIGTFHVYSKTAGVNLKGMVDSNYFIGGYAIHGYFDVPAFAASHGCLRIPIPNAREVFNWVRLGDAVIVQPR